MLSRTRPRLSGVMHLFTHRNSELFRRVCGMCECDPAAPTDAIHALFERFLPDDQRTFTLGANIDPQVILALRGDATRGRSVLTKAVCLSCHRLEQEGRAFGPDLTAIGLQLEAAGVGVKG